MIIERVSKRVIEELITKSNWEVIGMGTNKMKVASFLSGIGAQALGFQQAGGDLVYLNEFSRSLALTAEENLKVSVDIGDIMSLQPESLPDFDVMIANPPIIGFKHNQTELNGMEQALLGIVKVKRPRVICFEFYAPRHHPYLGTERLTSALEQMGYIVHLQTVSIQEISGLATRGDKTLVIAFADAEKAKQWTPTAPTETQIALKELVGGVQNNSYYLEDDYRLNQTLVPLVPEAQGVYRVKYDSNDLSVIEAVSETHCAQVSTFKLSQPFYVVRDEKGVRRFTIDEMKALQGLPSDFRFQLRASRQPQSFREQYIQMTQQLAISSNGLMMKRVAEAIYKTFKTN